MEKVFVLSLFRTATQSTKQFLEDLGYKTTHGIDSLSHDFKQTLSTEELFFELGSLTNNFDAFTDMPYHSMFEYFDNRYPGSKFILITRDVNSWIASVKKLYDFFENKTFNASEQFVYNKYFIDCPKDRSECTDEVLTKLYESHVFSVSKYFSDKDNLITIDLSDEDKESKIMNFLGITDPELINTKMQHLDFYKNMTKEKWKEYINQWTGEFGPSKRKMEKDFLKFINS